VRLETAGLLARTAGERLLPGRDLNAILVSDIDADTRWPDPVPGLQARIDAGVGEALGRMTLADLLADRPTG